MDKQTEDKINNSYVEMRQDFFNEIINDPDMGWQSLELHEMVQYLVAIEALEIHPAKDGSIIMITNTNDLFAWACADAEYVATDAIPKFFEFCLKDPEFGNAKWACYQNNRKPQTAFITIMKNRNKWESWMDDLQEPFM